METEVTPTAVLQRTAGSPEPTVAQIVKSLKDSPVYVQPGSPGATSSTSSEIGSLLNPNDHIVVVVLADGNSNLETLAKAVNKELGHNSIVAIARGDETVAYAPSFPTGTASDLMSRASNVSTSNIETVKTFIGNVQDYEAAHPETVTSTSQPGSLPPFVAIGGGFGGGLAIILIVAVSVRAYRRRIHSKVKHTSPRPINPLVSRLEDRSRQIADPQMQMAIETLCVRVEAYFKRLKTGTDDYDIAIDQMHTHLTGALNIADTFVKLEREPEYYTKVRERKRSGLQGIEGLSEQVLGAIRQRNSEQLLDYNVNVKILDAERHRYSQSD